MLTLSWLAIAGRAAVSGSSAAVLPTVVLAALGRRLAGSAAAPVNAVSHWYFGEQAARRADVSTKYTLSGYSTPKRFALSARSPFAVS